MKKTSKCNIKSFLELTSDKWCATIGNFDGVHLGHQYLIKSLKKKARETGRKSLVITFTPHPKELFSKSTLTLITDYKRRREHLDMLGVDKVIEIDFNRDFSTLSPTEFLLEYILVQEKIEYLLIGHDFQFGKNKSGDFEFLQRVVLENNLNLQIERTKAFVKDGKILSSSLIRSLIEEGKLSKANELLGHSYSLSGVVLRGDGRGKKIGFPTANILFKDLALKPSLGVYKTRVIYEEKRYEAITNVGVKPTVSDENFLNIETHIFNFDQDIYGEKIEVQFLEFIRKERKFNSLEDLVDQISLDVLQVQSSKTQ